MKSDCIFCKDWFPSKDTLVSDKAKYWYLVHDKNPICDFHCLVILKKDACGSHIDNMESGHLSNDIVSELWLILHKSSIAIKKSDKNIKNITITSLNSWENSKHLHFHLIPVFYNENIKKINDISKDWSWFSFLARKEIVQDTIDEFIGQTCWDMSDVVLSKIKSAIKRRVRRNIVILKNNFIF